MSPTYPTNLATPEKIRTALRQGVPVHTTLRNYRKDGTMFWNEVSIQPLRDANGNVTHFAGFHREGGDRLRLAESRDNAGNVTRSRPLFPYPGAAKYTGRGSTDDAANFVRAAPSQ